MGCPARLAHRIGDAIESTESASAHDRDAHLPIIWSQIAQAAWDS
jgi:hypothetical protein